MLKALREFGRSIGVLKVKITNPVLSYQASDYLMKTDESREKVHLEYLYKLDAEESSRLALLETKTSQMISQTGIIFSLLSLFVPLLIDKVADVTLLAKIGLSLLLFLAFVAYMLTISNALKNFKVNEFKYSRPSVKNVITFQNKADAEFYNEVIKDLIGGLKKNAETNNRKATNLLHSYNAFKVANLLMGALVAAFCITIFFLKPKDPTISVTGNVKINDLKQGFDQLNATIRHQDTLLKTLIQENIKTRHQADSLEKIISTNQQVNKK